MTSYEMFIARKIIPNLLCIFTGRISVGGNERTGFRMGKQKELLPMQTHHVCDPAQQRERRPASVAFQVGHMAGFYSQSPRQLSLRKSKCFAPSAQYLTQGVLFHR